MCARHIPVSAFCILVLTACSTPSPRVMGEQKIRIPEALAGNWVCGSTYQAKQNGRDMTVSTDSQWLIGDDGRFQFAGRMDIVATGEEFSISMFGEGETQMADGRAWTRYEDIIMLPVTDRLGKLAVGFLKDSLSQHYPRFETASYSVEGEYLTSVSEPRGIETHCTGWQEWQRLCREQNKTPCGLRNDKVQFEAIKQEFLEKQIVLEFDLRKLPD